MDNATDIFVNVRPRLLGLAYRMLGSLAEAEDVVQDVWLGWDESRHDVAEPEAWLLTFATRRAIDRLRSARLARESYVGMWLPEPILIDPVTPEQLQEYRESLSIAFLAVLERLTPNARAAFILHDVLEVGYAEIGATLGKNEAACRQLVHRAREQLQHGEARVEVPAQAHRRLIGRFADALAAADLKAMTALLDDAAVLVGDGGGIAISMPKPTVGGDRIARCLFAANLRYRDRLRVELVGMNEAVGVLRHFDENLEMALCFATNGERITHVYAQRNPNKLAAITARHPAHVI